MAREVIAPTLRQIEATFNWGVLPLDQATEILDSVLEKVRVDSGITETEEYYSAQADFLKAVISDPKTIYVQLLDARRKLFFLRTGH